MGRPGRHWIPDALIIAGASLLLFLPFLGQVNLFDWDEINFAESAREMLLTRDFLTVRIHFEPFWEKPPLFIWMQAFSMSIFGVNEFAARLPNAICGMVTLLALYGYGRKLVGRDFGLLWSFLYGTSLLPFVYFKSGIIDPWFNLFILAAILHFFLFTERGNPVDLLLSPFFVGLAILTKGPVALLIYTLTLISWWLINRKPVQLTVGRIVLFFLILIATGGFWFILQIAEGNWKILADFLSYQMRLFQTKDAGHGGFLLYHPLVLLVGVFPASFWALPVLLGERDTRITGSSFVNLLVVLFWIVIILFTIVQTKIVHYSSLCYFPITCMAAWSVRQGYAFRGRLHKPIHFSVVLLGILFAVLAFLVSRIEQIKPFLISRIEEKDPFAAGNLGATVDWSGMEWFPALFLLTGLILYANRIKKGLYFAGIKMMGISMILFLFFTMLQVIPKVEAYSQRAAIDFFRSVSRQNVYLATLGYKSYAHLFYGQVQEDDNPLSRNKDWLLSGAIDKDVCFSVKIHKKKQYMEKYPEMMLLYEKNGFVFFRRKSQTEL